MPGKDHVGLEPFSLEQYVDDWLRHRDSVIVEGTLQADGDYFVIDRDPAQPGRTLRVRKVDAVAEPKNARSSHSPNGDRQIWRIAIKRGVPVQSVVIIMSDELASPSGPRLLDTISVAFKNSLLYTETFTIQDTENKNAQIFNGVLGAGQSTGPLSLVSSDGMYGHVRYKYDGNAFGGSTLVEDQQTYDMN